MGQTNLKSKKDVSPICFEFKLSYGACWWCNGQAYPLLRMFMGKEELERTELWWKCRCGKEWPVRNMCAVIASREWRMEVVSFDKEKEPYRSSIWYPTCVGESSNANYLFTEEFLEDYREKEGLPRKFDRFRFTHDDWGKAEKYRLQLQELIKKLVEIKSECNKNGVEWCRLHWILAKTMRKCHIGFVCQECDNAMIIYPKEGKCPKCAHSLS